jgi:NRAMP (natural resistance-associated macrophage protein)-like metal ion transporter
VAGAHDGIFAPPAQRGNGGSPDPRPRETRAVSRARWAALAAVAGPGLLAGLSDDDPAGITTYSILGADHGYALLWVLVVSTLALIVFHEAGARMGVVTGQGLIGLIRFRYGVGWGGLAVVALVGANIGTACAEFAGIAAALEIVHISRDVSVPVAAVVISALVLRSSFHRVEHVLLALSAVLVAYVASGFLAGPDWGATARGMVVPSLPLDHATLVAATATVGTTLAPWGLAFIQSYVVDKRLEPADLRAERYDVVLGAVLTGVIGLFVVVACAATLHATGTSIGDARDAAVALRPLAGGLAADLYAAGLLGAALLAAAVLPLSTAYSVSEFLGHEAELDDGLHEAPWLYGTYAVVVLVAAAVVLVPGAPLVPILYVTQALNAVLLLPLLVFVIVVSRDTGVMGDHATGRVGVAAMLVTTALVALCVATLFALSVPTP